VDFTKYKIYRFHRNVDLVISIGRDLFIVTIFFCCLSWDTLWHDFKTRVVNIPESSNQRPLQSAAVIVTTNPSVDSGNQSDPYVEESCESLHALVFFEYSELTT
jgi:hypothetical protein